MKSKTEYIINKHVIGAGWIRMGLGEEPMSASEAYEAYRELCQQYPHEDLKLLVVTTNTLAERKGIPRRNSLRK